MGAQPAGPERDARDGCDCAAAARCARQRDTHLWLRAHVLDSLCAVGLASGDPRTAAWTTDLGAMAGRTGMRELAVRAYLYRSRLGDETAIDAARALAVDTDNPRLARLMEEEVTPLDDLLGRA